MTARWFRMSYSRNAMLRCLAASGLELNQLTVAEGIRSMVAFSRDFRPQHSEHDVSVSSARRLVDGYELRLVRRMRRHDHPEAYLTLSFTLDNRGTIMSRSLVQS